MRIPLNDLAWRVGGFIEYDAHFRKVWLNEHAQPSHGWVSATIPGHVQSDLFDAGLLPDPFLDKNSLAYEWTSDREWVYETKFEATAGPARLCFGGVDYACEVYLNGEKLGDHEGMFGFAFDVALRDQNRLVVIVKTAPISQTQIGDTSLVRHWKARFTYWWDFSARLVPQGIWGDVWLEVGKCVGEVWVRPGTNEVTVEPRSDAHVEILGPDGARLAQGAPGSFRINNPQLWWPNGLGEQALYTARVSIGDDSKDVRFGFRDLTTKDFQFNCNGTDFPINGWNWVPIHQLYGRNHEAAYRNAIGLAKHAGCNLIRIWGGGILERELFYDLCDEAGILVWQDFIQSSSGVDSEPATDPEYTAYCVREAEKMVRARRNHVSLAVWCAGNELAVGAQRIPLTDDHPNAVALKRVVDTHDPGRGWIVTTPTGEVPFASLGGKGLNLHGNYWYFGDGVQQRFYESLECAFQGEVGCEGAANIATLARSITKPWPPSDLWTHKGSWWYRLDTVKDAFGEIDDLETFVKASQWLQADGLRTIVEAALRRWPQQRGVVLWQLNEPWPNAICTAVLDVYGHAKPAYWTVANAYRGASSARREDLDGEWYDALTGAPTDSSAELAVCVLKDNAYVISHRKEQPFQPLLGVKASMQVVRGEGTLTIAAVDGPLHGVFVQTVDDYAGVCVSDGWKWFLRPSESWTIEARGELEVSALNAPARRVSIGSQS